MVILKFQNGADWFKANWVFRQLADDMNMRFPDNEELKHTLEKAQAFGFLGLDSQNPDAVTLPMSIKTTVEETINGKIMGWKRTHPEDEEGQQMYMQAMTELLEQLSTGENIPKQ